MLQDDLKLNQHKFAELVVQSHSVSDDLDPEAIVKRKLTLYLTAYYLSEKFNKLQSEIVGASAEVSAETFKTLLAQLKDDKFGDW